MKLSILSVFILLGFFTSGVFGVLGVEDSIHKFTSMILIPVKENCPNGELVIHFSCTASLIDSASLFGQDVPSLRRRIVLTAGHCVSPKAGIDGFLPAPERPFLLSFDQYPTRSIQTCSSPRVVGFQSNVTVYTGSNYWTNYVERFTRIEEDFAIVLLDRPVSVNDVPDPLPRVVFGTPDYLRPGNNQISSIASSGFGIIAFATNTEPPLGAPNVLSGPRARGYVELPVLSVSGVNIMAQQNLATSNQTLCGGDSGSPAFPATPDSEGVYSILGVTSTGDRQCRATNSFARVGTDRFVSLISSIFDKVVLAANN